MSTPRTNFPSWPSFARRVIEAAAGGLDPSQLGALPPEERAHAGVFVTLHEAGRLRGCMGTLDADTPLAEAVRYAAVSAAFHDPRFPPVTSTELPRIEIEVSIMSAPRRMNNLAELELGRHGVLVRRGARRGLFLPQVAVEHHMSKETFLSRCCDEKAGLPADAWRDPTTEVMIFTTEVCREAEH